MKGVEGGNELRKYRMAAGLIGLSLLLLTGCGQTSQPAVSKQPETKTNTTESEKTNLREAFAKEFSVGVAINPYQLKDEDLSALVRENFNSVTLENSMKPEELLDQRGCEESADGMPVINEEALGEILELAKENGLKVRGHCLVWHNQTPPWFFHEKYDVSYDRVDKETLKKRLEGYIQKVLTYCRENYPGVVYAWDVVNEAFDDAGGYRTKSNWYDIYGDATYIEDAFAAARKYAGDDVKLFLNDYNSYIPAKRDSIAEELKKLVAKGLVDGIGSQSHWDMNYPSAAVLEEELEVFSSIGNLEMQYTEIDMHNTDNSEQGLKAQAERYKEFFDVILKADREGKMDVTNVTFWGLNDEVTWLTDFKGETSYPLLFDADNNRKPCYDSLMELAK